MPALAHARCADPPCAGAGIGLKPDHYRPCLDDLEFGKGPDWVEVHPQNYRMAGGPAHRWLTAIAAHVPISLHSVGLSLGGADGVDVVELDELARLVDRYRPALVSDHLAWCGVDGVHVPDLLPLPYTDQTLAHVARQIDQVQNRLGRTILIENPSRMLAWRDDSHDEGAFLTSLARKTGCGLLLDLNNILVSAINLNTDPYALLEGFDPHPVGEIHLAGHKLDHHEAGLLAIDDHGSQVGEPCWALYRHFIAAAGVRPTLIEWDTDIPAYPLLMAQAEQARAAMMAGVTAEKERCHAGID